ncbi:MAG TPA: hypothetical protein EYP53_05830 [Candidatus Latescibacteria bacterium]|nr:hypothetical protein [Candidatus Latescibacterota bacterium]
MFTNDDRHVIFTSDRGGRCNVYMTEVRDGYLWKMGTL